MANNPILFLFSFFLVLCLILPSSSQQQQQTFIVHLNPSLSSHHSHHHYASLLQSLPLSSPSPASLLYSYSRVASGFSASLNPDQADALRRIHGIVSVVPDAIRHVHTTWTPHFLGLDETSGIWPNSDFADDVIVGVLDTGIWPERTSFSDTGLGPVPERWKGDCESVNGFGPCNRKVIGARAFYRGYEAYLQRPMDETVESKSPRDTEGHGTHTASTAAGSVAGNVSFYGYAAGTARGMASKARIAAYKICWKLGCFDSDILAAMDQAVADGVDVISLSVGATGYAPQYYHDSIAIGAFGAAQHGVLVSCSAGNSGPGQFTAVNVAPWILTVGASTIDREFPADVILGDGRIFGGVSLYTGKALGDGKSPLIYGGDCGSRYCYPGELDPSKVAGKIVVCDRGGNARVEKGSAVKLAGGVGMILANTAVSGEELIADSHLIPATMVGENAGNNIRAYVKDDPSPTAVIAFRGTIIGPFPPAPKVASFSSRGPNHLTAEILKPDVIAPGVNILAAWTGFNGPTDLDIDPRRVEFNIISGTSMSCPHASGLAALLRKAYPSWSPATIKSALMTTAYSLDNSGGSVKDLGSGEESNPFIHGAGHVDPNRALNPGLVYDINVQDYIRFLCSIGYDASQISVFVREPTSLSVCLNKFSSPGELNYPSFSVLFDSSSDTVKYKRTVKNVGSSTDAIYRVEVSAPPGVEVALFPHELVFSDENQTLSYQITFSSIQSGLSVYAPPSFGSIMWTDGTHQPDRGEMARGFCGIHVNMVGEVSSHRITNRPRGAPNTNEIGEGELLVWFRLCVI